MGMMRSVGVRLRLYTDQYRQDGARAVETNEDIARSGRKAGRDLDGMAMGFGLVGAAALAAAAAVVYTTAKFDKQMSEVKAVSGATTEQFGQLREAALAAGQATVFSASEAAEAISELAKAGVSTADILAGALRGSLDLASAGSLDLATAATIASNAMNTFGLKGTDVAHIADVLSAAANKSAVGVEDLGLGLQQVGLVAAQVGLTLEETVGILAAFGDRGLRGSDGATSLKTALLRLAAPQDEAKRLMDDLNISLYDANGNMVDAVTVAGQLHEGLGKLSASERNAALSTIFGSDAIRAANVLYELGADGLQDYIDAVNDQGAAARVAAEKLNNLAGDVKFLTGTLETLFIQAGSGANGPLRELVQTLNGMAQAFGMMPAEIQSAGVLIVGFAGLALLGTAAVIKLNSGLVAMNASLIASGSAGLVGARGLRLVTGAMGGLILALTAVTLAYSIYEQTVGDGGGVQRLITPQATKEIAGRLNIVADTLTQTADRVDAELTRMANAGRGAEAMNLIAQAAKNAGTSVDALLRQYPQFAAAMAAAGDVTAEQAAAAGQAAAENIRLAGAFGDAANEVNGLRNAFDKATASILGWRSAQRDAEAAVDALQEALKESNGSLDVTEEKGREAEAAVDALAKAAAEAAQQKYNETGSVEEANAVWEKYIEQLRLLLLAAGLSQEAVDELINSIAQMPEYKAITVDVKVQRPKGVSVYGQGVTEFAQGGIIRAAKGLVSRPGAAITNRPVLWGEAGTEAYVAKDAPRDRSLQILGEAAAWHGAQVVPAGGYATAGAPSGGVVEHRIVVSAAPGANQQLVGMFRFEVDQMGAGSVQDFVGSQGRR